MWLENQKKASMVYSLCWWINFCIRFLSQEYITEDEMKEIPESIALQKPKSVSAKRCCLRVKLR